MIQRIQSVYLLVATALFSFMFSNPVARIRLPGDVFLNFNHNSITAMGESGFHPLSTWQVTVLIVVIMLIGFVDIFLYRKRNLQMRLCVFNILLMFGLVGMIYYYTKYIMHKFNGVDSVFLWPIVIPFISIILTYLAMKSIRKDDALVKSYDRIR